MKLSTIVASLAFVPTLLSAQATLGVSTANGNVGSFGRPNTQTYGQTFRAPTTTTKLTSFSVWISSSTAFQMKAYLYAWNGTQATGSALFTSDLLFAPVGNNVKTTVDLGGLNLTGGNSYVFFLSTSGLTGSATATMGYNDNNAYANGAFVYQNNGDNTSTWTNTAWSTWSGSDLQFEAKFTSPSVVPEPSTYALMGTGLIGLAGVARRRRQA